MCGIAGELRFKSGESPANWEYISNLMARRGPDDDGLWQDDAYCTLVFRRLAILDLSPTGKQPMQTSDGRYMLVYNGEMYNYQVLRHELEQHGYRFRSSGDTEIVLYALAHWGPDALSRFNGMFALAFYDTVEKTLLLSRDHAGIKPLYIMQTDRGIVFASQYNQLLAHPWRENLAIQPQAIAKYLHHLYIPSPDALLEKTRMLDPGSWILIDAEGGIKQGYHFQWTQSEPDLSGEEALEAVDDAVTRAVKSQLISDVPLGTFLSGGIDSPLVTAKASELTNHTLRAYSIGTPGYEGDESQDAIGYAQAIGVEHILHQYTPETMLNNLQHVIAASTEPFADYSLFPTMMVAELARKDVTVILSGDGGDELFWGYTRNMIMLKYAPIYLLPLSLRQQLLPPVMRLFKRDYLSERLTFEDLATWFLHDHTALFPDYIRDIFPILRRYLPSTTAYNTGKRDDAAYWVRQAEFEEYLPEVLLKVDRGSMYHSLEVRVPLLDKTVIEVAQRINWETCVDLKANIGKLPLRKALNKHISHQTTHKRGFSVPMEEWLKHELRPLFEEKVLARNQILGLEMDADAVHKLYQAHLEQTYKRPSALWALLSLSLWEEHHYQPLVHVAV